MDVTCLFQSWNGLMLVLTGLLAIWLLIGRRVKKALTYPPGPAVWPIVGSIPSLVSSKQKPLDLLSSFAEKYGVIYRIRIMMTDIVIINDFQLMKDAFNHPDLMARPRITPIEDYIGRRNIGLAGSSGPVWREHRQFVHSAIRTFATGPLTVDDIIHEEAQTLISEMAKTKDGPFDPHKVINSAVSNVIAVMLFGKKYDYKDPDFVCLQEIINQNLQLAASGGIFIFIPFLARVPFSPAKQIQLGVQKFTDFTRMIVDEHRAQLDPNNPRDVIDLYLLKMQQTAQDGMTSTLDETNLLVLMGDLFGASTESTNASLKWSIIYMLKNPEVQARVQDELDRVVGRNRLPALSDRSKLPYTEATIHEIQRMGQVSPLGIAHACSADTTLAGYDIPAGALIVSNLWWLSRDGSIWNEPDQFRPERFLNGKGECFKPDELIPFGNGKRACIGEPIARKELFIFFASLLHKFTFKVPEESPPPSLDGRLGLVYDTQSYEVCALRRD